MQYLKLMRIKHYIKNILVFAPLVFAGKLFDSHLFTKTLIGFVIFSFIASVVYIINDFRDLETDKLHQIKKNRPLASGKIPAKQAVYLSVLLAAAALWLNITFNNTLFSWMFLIGYFLINIGYSFGLKNIPLLDITIIVAGFLLRVLYGGAICSVTISNWMYLTVIAMSFYFALGKRRNEIKKLGNVTRSVFDYYTEAFLDKHMYVCLALTIVFYSLWCITPKYIAANSENLIWTVPLVMLTFMRYNMNIEGDSYGDPADVVFADKVLVTLMMTCGAVLLVILYGTELIELLGI